MPDDDQSTFSLLGIRMPEELRQKIKAAAEAEERTESSFARYYLSKAADATLAETTNTSAEEP